MTRIVGLVQARMGSSRLPGKVMKPLAATPLIGHIFERLRATAGIDDVVLATTADPRNDPMVEYAQGQNVAIWRQDGEDDIVGRLAGAARHTNADAILKVNADCPMVDPGILSRLTAAFLADPSLDYVSNKVVWTWPEGMSAEIIATQALQWCDANLTGDEDRELVANWVRDHTDRFRRLSIEADRDYYTDHPKLSVDTPEDFAEATAIFDALYRPGHIFGFDAIRSFLLSQSAR